MCGRVCCTLSPDDLSSACSYKNNNGKFVKVPWIRKGYEYKECTNISPRDVVPCILSGEKVAMEDKRVLCPMLWSIIPPWIQGDLKQLNIATHNSCVERVFESKLYSPLIEKKQRCIVVVEGFYEWSQQGTVKGTKQPYYIYKLQKDGIKADVTSTWNNSWSEDDGWNGFNLIKLAALFNTFKSKEGEEKYSCTILTRMPKSNKWIHDRIPIMLNSDRDEKIWLHNSITSSKAIELIQIQGTFEDTLKYHTVSSIVNKSLNKSEDCRKYVKRSIGQTSLLNNWLAGGSIGKRKSEDSNHNNTKRTKN
ncbi:abasic site processing protein HMCES [Prorops nasuta]|uniref:abasic site processing protein HMCES n=1 Tax=Prorops nasuta TaxID=863751 RepID=UPI0034CD31C7